MDVESSDYAGTIHPIRGVIIISPKHHEHCLPRAEDRIGVD